MRYVKLKKIVSRIVDEVVDDPETVRAIVQLVKDKSLDCIIQLNDNPKMSPARIVDYNDEGFTFLVIHRMSRLRKECKYKDLSYLEVTTQDEILVRTRKGISRWMLLDPSAFEILEAVAEQDV